jgi:OsmC-like protein
MAGYEIELRTVPGDGSERAAPYNLRIEQRRLGPVELRLGTLSGGHALHFALAMCVLNNLGREAKERGIRLENAVVVADGGFNEEGTRSTGIEFRIELQGDATAEQLQQLAKLAADDSTIVESLRHPTTVTFGGARVTSTIAQH